MNAFKYACRQDECKLLIYFGTFLDRILVNYDMGDFLGRKWRIVQVFRNVCFWA